MFAIPSTGRALTRAAVSLALLLALAGRLGAADGVAENAREKSVDPGVNEAFLADDLEVDEWVKRFEGESREIALHRDAILGALSLRPGQAVADIGAGTGLFLAPLSKAVGPRGRVYAQEIAPRFLEHLRGRVARSGLENVTVVEGSERSAELTAGSVDLVFLCDVYHHFEYPRSMLASLRAALRPNGTLVVVDFERVPGKSRDWILEHVRAGKEVFAEEISQAGFEPLGALAVDGLVENYVLRFRRP